MVLRYAEFVPYSMIDGRKRSIKFVLISETLVAAKIPHFWRYAGIFILFFLFRFYFIFTIFFFLSKS